jgi:hypothetical protein
MTFLRWLIGLLLGSVEGSRKHIATLYALTLIYALGVQSGAPEWAADALVFALGVGVGANVGEWWSKRRRPESRTPSPAAASPSPHPAAAGDGASAP